MANKKKVSANVFRQDEIAQDIYDLWVETDLAQQAKPGQFVSLYPKNQSTLLPRPISICEADKENNRLRMVYRVMGQGTKEFATYHTGDSIAVLGTLGNGYDLEKADGKTVFLMGGGIGIPPMLELAKRLKERGKTQEIIAVLGYRNELFLLEDFEKYATVYVATEDGSKGSKGTVMDAISENGLKADMIMACGPMPMLRAIKKFAMDNEMEAYISLEERMACGVGACLGCVVKTEHVDHHSHVNNARICTDGPVYDAKEVMI